MLLGRKCRSLRKRDPNDPGDRERCLVFTRIGHSGRWLIIKPFKVEPLLDPNVPIQFLLQTLQELIRDLPRKHSSRTALDAKQLLGWAFGCPRCSQRFDANVWSQSDRDTSQYRSEGVLRLFILDFLDGGENALRFLLLVLRFLPFSNRSNPCLFKLFDLRL